MAFELIKVSELPELMTPADANVLPIQDGDYLKRISYANLKDAAVGDMEGSLAAAYDSTATYAVGDYCIYEGQLYRCTTAITTAEAWTAGHWTVAVLTDDLAAEVTARESAVSDEATARGNADTAILADLASPYSASSTYAVGDYCTKDEQLYRCTTAITTAEAWTAAHWSAVALGDDTRDLRSALKLIEDDTKLQNLFDVSTAIQGGYFGAQGQISDNANSYYSTQYIPVEAGVEYRFSSDGTNLYIATYNDSFVHQARNNPSGNTHTFASGIAYVRLSIYNKAFPSGFKFAKSSDFYSVTDNYERLLDGSRITDNSIMEDAVSDASTIEVGITEKVTLSKISNKSTIFTTRVGYINTQGNFVEDSNYTSFIFQAVNNFDLWEDATDLTTASDTLFMGITNTAPPASLVSGRYRRDMSGTTITQDTLPQSNSKLLVGKGQYVVISCYTKSGKGFVFNVDGLQTGDKVFSNNVLLNDNQIAEARGGIGVKVESGKYTFSINGYTTYIEHTEDQETRADLWTIRGVYKGDQTICNRGTDIIGVLREVGQGDFMGGIHGDETNIVFKIIGDGAEIVSDGVFGQVDVIMVSHLTRPLTGDNVIDRFVHIVFKDNYIEIENTFKCLVNNFSLDYAYNGGLFAWYDADADFQMSNIGVISSGGGSSGITLQASHELFSTSALIDDSFVTVENIIGHEKSTFSGEVYYYGSSDKRIKTYFSTEHGTTWNTGNICKGKCRYTLS